MAEPLKILLLGNTGQLGWELERSLQPLGKVAAFDYPRLDLAKPTSLRELLHDLRPQVIVNAAAYTSVDKAENEPDLAEAVNGSAPGLLAEHARRLDALLIHYSTDYVFDGQKGSPYKEGDPVSPVNVYGRTKLHGEQAVGLAGCRHLVLRTSWVYSLRQGGFVNKVLDWARRQETLRMVSDQVGNPTWCRMLAEVTAQLLAGGLEMLREHSGLYHLAGEGTASRLDWARLILELDPHREEQKVRDLVPALTAEFPTPAQRPLFSALNCSHFQATFGLQLPDWRFALRLAMG